MAWTTHKNLKKIAEFRKRFKALICEDHKELELADMQAQVSEVMFELIFEQGQNDVLYNPPNAESATAGASDV